MSKQKEISIKDVYNHFNTEDQCIAYLEKLRWADVPKCTRDRCESTDVKKHKTQPHQWYCRTCQKDFNVKRGTIFFNTKLPLQDWFATYTYMLIIRKGISSYDLARTLKIQVKTAWLMMRKIREIMAEDSINKQLLQGVVETDELCNGGKIKWHKRKPNAEGKYEKFQRGLGSERKIRIIGDLQREKKDECGNIIEPQIFRAFIDKQKDLKQYSLFSNLVDHVDIENSTILSDGLTGYKSLGGEGTINHKYCTHNDKGWFVDKNDYSINNNSVESSWRVINANTLGSE